MWSDNSPSGKIDTDVNFAAFCSDIVTMKGVFCSIVVVLAAQGLWAQSAAAEDDYSLAVLEKLRELRAPVAPIIVDGSVIFTAPSTYRLCGASFSHENFAKIHWFKRLDLPLLDLPLFDETSKAPRELYGDSGVLFLVYTPPSNVDKLSYRMVADGLWQSDPHNPNTFLETSRGIRTSLVNLPRREKRAEESWAEDSGRIYFDYADEPNQSVYLTGSFNNWDPFMYELREYETGRYSLSLALEAGSHQYAFVRRGERVKDPLNPKKAYLKDGTVVSALDVTP